MGSRCDRVASCFCVLLVACSGAPALEAPSLQASTPSASGVLVDKQALVPAAFSVAYGDQTPAAIDEAFGREPVFLAQATVVDRAFAMSRLGMRWQTDARRVRWKLTETRLEARLVDDGTLRSPSSDSERAIAAFSVTEHLELRDGLRADPHDVPVGAPIASARPWFARPYMRVDFSRNLVERVALSPDDDNPWVPMGPAAGASSVRFDWDPPRRFARSFRVDTTVSLLVEGPRSAAFGAPDRGLCALTATRPWECAPQRALVRWSFAPASVESMIPARSLSPLQTETLSLESIDVADARDRSRSVSITAQPRLWSDPWKRDDRGHRVSRRDAALRSLAVAELGASSNVFETRPIRQRSITQIPLFVLDADADEREVTEVAASHYNATMDELLREARRRECVVDEPRTDEPCDRWRSDQPASRVIVLCHSPVWGSDPALPGFHSRDEVAAARARGWDADACGPQSTTASVGDGRRHVVAFVGDDDRRVGPVLIVGSTVDRGTHEIAATQMLVRRGEIEVASDSAVSWMRVANGEITEDSVRRGEELREPYPGIPLGAGWDPWRGPDLGSNLADLSDTTLEAALLDREQRAIALADPRASALTRTVREIASPAAMFNAAHFDAARRAHNHRARSQCELTAMNEFTQDTHALQAWLAAFGENRAPLGGYLGAALDFRTPDRLVRWESAAVWVRRAMRYRAIAHGIGHMLGLAHNLAGSADVTNYRDPWWVGRSARPLVPRRAIASRGEAPYAEIEHVVTDAQGSSLMDLDPFVPLGVGRADRAMLARGFFGLVEAFRSVDQRELMLSLSQRLIGDSLLNLEGTGTAASLRLRSQHYTELPAVIGSVSARGLLGDDVRVPNLSESNRYWVFTDETRSVAYNGFGWEPIANNEAVRGPDGEPSSALVVPYRVRRDWHRGERWDALADHAAAEPFDVLYPGAGRGALRLFWWDLASQRRPSRTLSEYVHLARRGEYEALRALSMLAHEDRELRRAVSELRNYAEWRQSNEVEHVLGVAHDAIDRALREVMMPLASWTSRVYSNYVRPEDGVAYYREAPFGVSGAFELGGWLGSPRRESSFVLRPDGSIAVEFVGSHHVRVLYTLLLADIGAPGGETQVEFLPAALESSREGALRALASILCEDWADVGMHVSNPGRNVVLFGRSLRTLASDAPSRLQAIQPDLPLELRRWIAVAFIRGAASSDRRFIEWSRVTREGDRDAPPVDRRVTFRDPLSGVTWVAEHIDASGVARAADPGASELEVRRAIERCPPGEGDCAAWARLHAERGIAARLLLRGRALAEHLSRTTEAREIERVTMALREVTAMIAVLRQLTTEATGAR